MIYALGIVSWDIVSWDIDGRMNDNPLVSLSGSKPFSVINKSGFSASNLYLSTLSLWGRSLRADWDMAHDLPYLPGSITFSLALDRPLRNFL